MLGQAGNFIEDRYLAAHRAPVAGLHRVASRTSDTDVKTILTLVNTVLSEGWDCR